MATVALFATCMSDIALPGPAQAAHRVLTALGFEVVVPARQSCCGQPALNSGYPGPAADLVSSFLRTFGDFEHVVSVAGSCAAMLVQHGPHVAPGEAFPRISEFSQFVVEHGGGLDLRVNARVTYHDSCHMTRVLGERRTPRALLAMIKGVELVEMADSDACCGFGGTFAVKFPEVSVAMADMKLASAADTGPDYIVSSDPGCMVHLATRAAAVGAPVRLLHLAQLTALALPTRTGART